MRVAEFKMRLFVFVADKLLKWGRRVEQEAGYVNHDPADARDPSLELSRGDSDRDGPPEHWARLVKSVPPPHWLELLRRASEEEQCLEDGGSLEQPLALEETEVQRSAVENSSSEEQPRVVSPTETAPNPTDYSAHHQRIRDLSRPAIPAVTPAKFLDRLHFAAERPATEKPGPVYQVGKPAEAVKPGMYPDGSRQTANALKPVSAPTATSATSRDKANFPVGTPPSPNSLNFTGDKSSVTTARAATTPNRIESAHRSRESDGEVTREVVSETRAQTEHSNESRQPPAETENLIANRRRYFRRRPRGSSRALNSEYPQSNSQPPAAASYVNSQPRSRITRVSVPGPAPVTSAESYLKFSEQPGERLLTPRTRAKAFTENYPARQPAREIFSDLNTNYWPTLPPAPSFDLADDLSARETEAETLRRLEQEQRGTLWSE